MSRRQGRAAVASGVATIPEESLKTPRGSGEKRWNESAGGPVYEQAAVHRIREQVAPATRSALLIV